MKLQIVEGQNTSPILHKVRDLLAKHQDLNTLITTPTIITIATDDIDIFGKLVLSLIGMEQYFVLIHPADLTNEVIRITISDCEME